MAALPIFNVLDVIEPRIDNYNKQTLRFLRLVENVFSKLQPNCQVVFYSNFKPNKEFVVSRGTYYCQLIIIARSIKITEKIVEKKLDFPWLVMIGSHLDFIIRVFGVCYVSRQALENAHMKQIKNDFELSFQFKSNSQFDKLYTCFIISGTIKQLPLFITNNKLNYHLVKTKVKTPTIRKFIYKDGKGTLLEYLSTTDTVIVSSNKNEKSVLHNVSAHWMCKFCSECGEIRPVLKSLFAQQGPLSGLEIDYLVPLHNLMRFYSKKQTGIDHLGNKLVIEPGDFFNLVFLNDVYPLLVTSQPEVPLSDNKKLTAAVKAAKKALLTGKGLMHVLSKRTVFAKETIHNTTKIKYTGNTAGSSDRQYGEGGVVFFESSSNLFLSVSLSVPEIVPFLASVAKKALSAKVKDNRALAFNKSYTGFLCPMFTSESKNIGRIVCLCRDVYVSTDADESAINDLELVLRWFLTSRGPLFAKRNVHLLVYNNCPFLLSFRMYCKLKSCLLWLKRQFVFIEAYDEANIIFIRYESQLLMKKVKLSYEAKFCFLTPNDFEYWLRIRQDDAHSPSLGAVINERGWDFVTSWWSMLLPSGKHNLAQKNLLFLNNLRNAITATDNSLANFFSEANVQFQNISAKHTHLFEPANEISKLYSLRVPRFTMIVNWFKGYNEEDCLILNSRIAQTCMLLKHTTLRLEVQGQVLRSQTQNANTMLVFQEAFGDIGATAPWCVGRIFESSNCRISVTPATAGVTCKSANGSCFYVYFNKPGKWRILSFQILKRSKEHQKFDVVVHMELPQPLVDGDKLCSFHGQKGIVKLVDEHDLPAVWFDGKWSKPDVIIHPDSIMRRQTLGHVLEDPNSTMVPIKLKGEATGQVLLTKTKFIFVNYRSAEHLYVADECMYDAVIGQPTKGANRRGGMKLGIMEIRNCLYTNGLSKLAEETLHEHSDRTTFNDCIASKALFVCREDAKFHKCTYVPLTKECVSYKVLC